MEDYQYEMINIFNKNFICSDVRKIIKLYKKDISLVDSFEDVNFKEEKFMHPLFNNYNYCLFCEQKRKTKFYYNNLIEGHMDLGDKTIGDYLLNNNIKLRKPTTKIKKLGKRRFIRSYDNTNTKNNLNNDAVPSSDSDTELYVNETKTKNKKNLLKTSNSIKRKSPNIMSPKNEYIINSGKSTQKKEKKSKNEAKNNKNLNNFGNFPSSGGREINLVNKSSERKINLSNSNNSIENSVSIEGIKINTENEETKTNVNEGNDNNNDNDNVVIIRDENNKYLRERKESNNNEYKNKKYLLKNTLPKSEKNLEESLNVNSEEKFIDKEKEKGKNQFKTKAFKSAVILSEDSDEEKEKEVKKSNKVMDVLKETKMLFGFGQKRSKSKINIGDNALRKSITKESKNKHKGVKNYTEINDKCSICLSEITEKFTLACGDFFCRDCIRNTIITAMYEISNLDKLKCPSCKGKMEENTIRKLITEEEFQKYQNLITKIEGLKNKLYIPCPYPDCPGWAQENQSNHNIYYCQYEHTFCKKCLEIVEQSCRQNPNEHKCFSKMNELDKKTKQFFKENKNIRKCPKCQSMVVREGGACNNMTCPNVWCKYEFCWICNKQYDDLHYKNPLSMCFGLSETNYEGKLAKYSRVRFFRCILIFVLIIFILLPVIIVFFSLFEIVLFIISFVLDGSGMKNIKLKSRFLHKLFYKIVYAFFVAIGVAYIPLGYMSLVVLAIFAPAACIFNKIREKNDDEID